MKSLVWFRNDLRICDNPALSAAMADGPCIAVYCLSVDQWDEHDLSPAKRSLIVRQLRDLQQQLETLNVPMLVLSCPRYKDIPHHLVETARRLNTSQLYFNHEYELNERRCAQAVVEALNAEQVTCRAFHDQCALKPGSVLNQHGDMYKVFSAFKRAYIKNFWEQTRAVYKRPEKQKKLELDSDLKCLDELDICTEWDESWPAGEVLAQDRLQAFINKRVHQYKAERDFPALDATSELSPYLAVGALTTTQCLNTALSANEGLLDGGKRGVDTWISELIWRDFYRHLLYAFPKLCRYQAFKAETERLPWRHDEYMFERWKQGRTGYPLVDAAMRQLKQRAWMHNRLRMVCAMFLTKHLFIDWRWGERYFMQMLVDGDLASNNGGWQWSASTGVDAVPYFRIFNPVRQSERFDPDGKFIRKYVHELASLENKSIHMPTVEQAEELNYPAPIIDHKQAVADTKAWFKAL